MATTSIAVFATTLIVSLTPGLFEQVSARALDDRLMAAGPDQRNITVGKATRIPARAGDDPFSEVRAASEAFGDSQLPEAVRDLVNRQVFVAEAPRYEVSSYPEGATATPSFLTIRYVQDVEDNTTLAKGEAPALADPVTMRSGADCPPIQGNDPALSPDDVVEDVDGDGVIACENELVPVFQVAASAATMTALGLDVGDRLVLSPDRTDARVIHVPTTLLDYRVVVEFSGVLTIDEPDDEYWFGDTSLARPGQFLSADIAIIYATALMAPHAYQSLSERTGSAYWAYTFRYMVDRERITPSSVTSLAADVRAMQSEHPTVTSAVSQEYTLRTGLGELLTDYAQRRNLAIALLSSSMAGLLAVALATIVVLATLASGLANHTTVLFRSRGSSRIQLTMTRLFEGTLLILLPAAAAYFLAHVIAPVESSLPLRAAVFTASSSLFLYTLAGTPQILAPLGRLLRQRADPGRASIRQIVLEALLVVIALATLGILRRRGLAEEGRLDILIALGPGLLAVAVSIATLRIYLLPISLAAWVGRRLRGVVTFVGFRRVLQTSRVGRAPLTVILLAVAVSVFAAVVRSSIDEGQEQSTWQVVGADDRITGRAPGEALPALLDVSDIEGVEAVASAALFPSARLRGTSSDLTQQADVLAVDLEALDTVSGGTPADPELPLAMVAHDDDAEIGTQDLPIPAVLSGRWPGTRPSVGDVFSLFVEGQSSSYVVIQSRDRFPGLDNRRPTVIASLAAVAASISPSIPRQTEMYVKGAGASEQALREAVSDRAAGAVLFSQQGLKTGLSEEAFAKGVDIALDIITAMSALFAVGAALSSLVLMAPARRRDFSYLRTQGLAGSQALQLTLIEQLPPVLIAATVGALLGAGMVSLLAPSIDLPAFTGPGFQAAVEVNGSIVLAVTAGLIVVMMIAVLIFGYSRRNEHLADVLSLGDE